MFPLTCQFIPYTNFIFITFIFDISLTFQSQGHPSSRVLSSFLDTIFWQSLTSPWVAYFPSLLMWVTITLDCNLYPFLFFQSLSLAPCSLVLVYLFLSWCLWWFHLFRLRKLSFPQVVLCRVRSYGKYEQVILDVKGFIFEREECSDVEIWLELIKRISVASWLGMCW